MNNKLITEIHDLSGIKNNNDDRAKRIAQKQMLETKLSESFSNLTSNLESLKWALKIQYYRDNKSPESLMKELGEIKEMKRKLYVFGIEKMNEAKIVMDSILGEKHEEPTKEEEDY